MPRPLGLACASNAPGRVLRFSRMRDASAAELQCALECGVCAVFDAVVSKSVVLVVEQASLRPPFLCCTAQVVASC